MTVQKITKLFPNREVDLDGRRLTIKSFPMKHLAEVFEAVQFAQLVLSLLYNPETVMSGLGVFLQESGTVALGYVMRVIELTTGLLEEEINELDYDLVVQLFAEIIEVNADFFGKFKSKLKPMDAVASNPIGVTTMPPLSEEDIPQAS